MTMHGGTYELTQKEQASSWVRSVTYQHDPDRRTAKQVVIELDWRQLENIIFENKHTAKVAKRQDYPKFENPSVFILIMESVFQDRLGSEFPENHTNINCDYSDPDHTKIILSGRMCHDDKIEQLLKALEQTPEEKLKEFLPAGLAEKCMAAFNSSPNLRGSNRSKTR